MIPNDFPPGLDEQSVRGLIEHYENQTDEEAAAEHEAALARLGKQEAPSPPPAEKGPLIDRRNR